MSESGASKIRAWMYNNLKPGDQVSVELLSKNLPKISNKAVTSALWAITRNKKLFKVVNPKGKGMKIYQILEPYFEYKPKPTAVYKSRVRKSNKKTENNKPMDTSLEIDPDIIITVNELRDTILECYQSLERLSVQLENA